MDEGDPRDEIPHLEARIEELSDTIEHCRKLILLSKAAMATGAVMLCGFVLGVFGGAPLPLFLAITAILGGVVVLGSNMTTTDNAIADLKAAEARRAGLIGMIDLHVVGNGAGRG